MNKPDDRERRYLEAYLSERGGSGTVDQPQRVARAVMAVADAELDELRAKLDAVEALIAKAEAENAARPPLFNGARFPAQVQTSALREVLGRAA